MGKCQKWQPNHQPVIFSWSVNPNCPRSDRSHLLPRPLLMLLLQDVLSLPQERQLVLQDLEAVRHNGWSPGRGVTNHDDVEGLLCWITRGYSRHNGYTWIYCLRSFILDRICFNVVFYMVDLFFARNREDEARKTMWSWSLPSWLNSSLIVATHVFLGPPGTWWTTAYRLSTIQIIYGFLHPLTPNEPHVGHGMGNTHTHSHTHTSTPWNLYIFASSISRTHDVCLLTWNRVTLAPIHTNQPLGMIWNILR